MCLLKPLRIVTTFFVVLPSIIEIFVMKILSYNIHHSSQEKIDKVISYDADINVIPELACPKLTKLPNNYDQVWQGVYEKKGLGVLWKNTVKCETPQWWNEGHKYIRPLIVDNSWLLIAAWPTVHEGDNKVYPQILLEALCEYEPYLKQYPTLITGDFNCFIGQNGANPQTGRLEDIVAFLAKYGIVSLYHSRTGENFGEESRCTYHHMFNESSRFFLDYTFTNLPVFAYELAVDWDKMSDHHPQMIAL